MRGQIASTDIYGVYIIYIYICRRTRIWGRYVRYRAANGNVKLDYICSMRAIEAYTGSVQPSKRRGTRILDVISRFVGRTFYKHFFVARSSTRRLYPFDLSILKMSPLDSGIYTREKHHVLKSSCMHRLNVLFDVYTYVRISAIFITARIFRFFCAHAQTLTLYNEEFIYKKES